MRVLIDYRPALRDRTGVGEFVHHLVTALADPTRTDAADDPLEVTAFSASWKDRLVDAPPPLLPPQVRTIDRRIPVSLLNLAWHRTGWPPIEALTGRTYDVVHSPHPLLLPSRSAARIITIHDLDFLDHAGRATGEIRRDYPALVRRHARQADHIVVPSRYTAADVEHRLGIPPEMISICPLGAPDWPPRDHTPHPGHLLFVGTLGPRKNVTGLIDAYARLIADRPDTPDLVLAGTEPAHAPWRERIGRAPWAGRVRCPGYVDRSTLRTLYGDARVLVMPSLDEGFGLPALEAMTVGVPVVAADRGALPEVVGDAGLLVDPTDTEALAGAISRMLSDDRLSARCTTRGIARARRFRWQASTRALRDAYRRAVDAGATSHVTGSGR